MANKKSAPPSPIQSILADAKAKDELLAKAIRASDKQFKSQRYAYRRWTKIIGFHHSIAEEEYWPRYARLLLQLGKTLAAGRWQSRIDSLSADGGDAKVIAIKMLRFAMAGDKKSLDKLRQECVSAGSIAYDVGHWLRVGLMNDVLGINEPREAMETEVSAAEDLCALIGVNPPAKPNPKETKPDDPPILEYDSVKREFRWNGKIIKTYAKQRITHQEEILKAFQDANWPESIDSPFPNNKSKTNELISELNGTLAGKLFKTNGAEKIILIPLRS